jgi:hypothetical protein
LPSSKFASYFVSLLLLYVLSSILLLLLGLRTRCILFCFFASTLFTFFNIFFSKIEFESRSAQKNAFSFVSLLLLYVLSSILLLLRVRVRISVCAKKRILFCFYASTLCTFFNSSSSPSSSLNLGLRKKTHSLLFLCFYFMNSLQHLLLQN